MQIQVDPIGIFLLEGAPRRLRRSLRSLRQGRIIPTNNSDQGTTLRQQIVPTTTLRNRPTVQNTRTLLPTGQRILPQLLPPRRPGRPHPRRQTLTPPVPHSPTHRFHSHTTRRLYFIYRLLIRPRNILFQSGRTHETHDRRPLHTQSCHILRRQTFPPSARKIHHRHATRRICFHRDPLRRGPLSRPSGHARLCIWRHLRPQHFQLVGRAPLRTRRPNAQIPHPMHVQQLSRQTTRSLRIRICETTHTHYRPRLVTTHTKKRLVGIEPTTYSLEGCRSTI